MRFKLDENLPLELAELLADAEHDVATVVGQELRGIRDSALIQICVLEERALVTFDLDFADIRMYPPTAHSGLLVLRLSRQDKGTVLAVFRSVVQRLAQEQLKGRLWIVEDDRIRVRS